MRISKTAVILLYLAQIILAFAGAVDDRNPVFDQPGVGVVVGEPTGGNLGNGTVNATGIFVNGTAVAGGLAVPNASLIGGNGSALSGVAIGANLTLNNGTLAATGGGASLPASAPLIGSNGSGSGTIVTPSNGLSISGTLLVPTFGTIANTFVQGNDSRLSTFTSGTAGLVPASGGSASTYLNGAGAFTTPAGGGNVSNSGTPAAGQVAVWTGATQVQGVSATGTGSPVLATSPTLVTPALGTPSALTLTNATGLPIAGIAGLGTGVASSLAAAVTGSGGSVLATSPTIASPTMTGTTTTAGITDSGGVNTTSTNGFQFGGTTVLNFQTASGKVTHLGALACPNVVSASGTPTECLGNGAGAVAPAGSLGESVLVGGSVLGVYAGSSGRFEILGDGAFYQMKTSAGFITAMGGDIGRDVDVVTDVAAFGDNTYTALFASHNTVFGNNSMRGNSSAIVLSGTPTAGDVINLALGTSTCLPSNPTNVAYTVPASPTLAGITTALAAAITAAVPGTCMPVATDVNVANTIALQNSGGDGNVGWNQITVTGSVTGTTVMTITHGDDTVNQIGCFGDHCMIGYGLTSAYYDWGFGTYSLASLTSGNNDTCGGAFSGASLTTAIQTTCWGSGSMQNATASKDTATGAQTLANDVGSGANTADGYAACQNLTTTTFAFCGGYNAGLWITTAPQATATGAFALAGTASNPVTGTGNTADGYSALTNCSSCYQWTVTGASAAQGTSSAPMTSYGGTIYGYRAFLNLQGGAQNITGVGANIGGTCTTGYNVILIGDGFTAVDCPAATGNIGWMNLGNVIRAGLYAPTISSGFGTSPTVSAGTTSGGFEVNVGTGGVATSGVVKVSNTATTTDWVCTAVDKSNPGTSDTVSVPTSTTTITLNNYSRTTGAAAAWAASDVIAVSCNGL